MTTLPRKLLSQLWPADLVISDGCCGGGHVVEDGHVGVEQQAQAQLQLTALLQALKHTDQGTQQGPQEVLLWAWWHRGTEMNFP